ncbi:MAG: DUF3878 family protein [Blautia sp.]|jgi:hypothetical protein
MEKEKYQSLREFLPGWQEDMPEAYGRLAEIFAQQVFELHMGQGADGKPQAYIPYMMNDSLECYLILENCRVTGGYQPEFAGETKGELAMGKEGKALIIRQEDQVCTLWFDDISQSLCCYQYHRIGHFWVKGQEQWRQLVYLVGTIYDKYQYLGEKLCNSIEKELLLLMEFAPFRYWSPIRESLDNWYEDTKRGALCMKDLARKAGDKEMEFWAGLYGKIPFSWLSRHIAHRMERPGREKLYRSIWKLVEEASASYPARSYGKDADEKIEIERKETEKQLKALGMQGQYPFFWHKDLQVTAMEEHPFTILEGEDFKFRIQLMVSRTGKGGGWNGGFFKGKGRAGWIEKKENLLTLPLRKGI